jgi:two-component system, NtrC family, nitrogen regulation response regulator NtrX
MTPPRILLVDDELQVVRYMQTALEENGYAVTPAISGEEALSSIQANLPDLLILDLNMPPPDGFDLLKTVRSKYPYLRILVISGYLHGPLLQAATLLGAIATLEKPVAPEALIAKVGELLGR